MCETYLFFLYFYDSPIPFLPFLNVLFYPFPISGLPQIFSLSRRSSPVILSFLSSVRLHLFSFLFYIDASAPLFAFLYVCFLPFPISRLLQILSLRSLPIILLSSFSVSTYHLVISPSSSLFPQLTYIFRFFFSYTTIFHFQTHSNPLSFSLKFTSLPLIPLLCQTSVF